MAWQLEDEISTLKQLEEPAVNKIVYENSFHTRVNQITLGIAYIGYIQNPNAQAQPNHNLNQRGDKTRTE